MNLESIPDTKSNKAILVAILPLILSIFFQINCNSTSPIKKLPDDPKWKDAFKRPIKRITDEPQIVAVLQEPCKFPSIFMDSEHFYVIPKVPPNTCNINIYRRNPFALVTNFLRKGEGPGEVKWISAFKIYSDFLFVSSAEKISYFSKSGKLLKEVRKKPWLSPCIPVSGYFVAKEFSGKLPEGKDSDSFYTESRFVLLDENFKKIKLLYSGKTRCVERFNFNSQKRELAGFNDCSKMVVYKEKIFIGSSDSSFFFTVFDAKGNNLYQINKPVTKRPVTKEIKNRERKEFYKDLRNKVYDLHFFDFFPTYRDFFISDDRIYVFMFPEEKLHQLIVLDLEGKFIGTQMLPYKKLFDFSGNYLIKKKKIYFLEENMEKELWEIKMLPLLF